MASLWEFAIKVSSGKLTLQQPLADMIAALRQTGMISILPIADSHLVRVSSLPLHHRDPFDRLLIAQAFADGLTVIGDDVAFDNYGVARLW